MIARRFWSAWRVLQPRLTANDEPLGWKTFCNRFFSSDRVNHDHFVGQFFLFETGKSATIIIPCINNLYCARSVFPRDKNRLTLESDTIPGRRYQHRWCQVPDVRVGITIPST
jgi:hypothetical protein